MWTVDDNETIFIALIASNEGNFMLYVLVLDTGNSNLLHVTLHCPWKVGRL